MKEQVILNDPFKNKGTAFTTKERDKYNLNGALPPRVETLKEQGTKVYHQFKSKQSSLEKRLFLMNIFNTNRTLFYYLVERHISEFMPIIYDPTIADSIEQYSQLFVNPQNAVFLSIDSPKQIKKSLKDAADGRDIRLIVVSDSQGILGIGDWGVNGVDITVGKLMVYTAAAGINPAQVLPVVLDVGTDNKHLLKDPEYLGNRHARIQGKPYLNFVDQFVNASRQLFPQSLLHFEDFGRANASIILDKYKNRLLTFNDDIQGTGIISLAGVLGGLNISGEKITQQKFLTFGAGTAGVGIASMLYDELINAGLSAKEAKKHFYLVDKQGLLFEDTPNLTDGQKKFTRKRMEFTHPDKLTDLYHIVQAIRPTVMIGTSTKPKAFTKKVVQEMAQYTKRPIIFPLSNPTKLAEAKAQDLLEWTKGKALVATGVPTNNIKYQGINYEIGQANNALVYPGVGFGAIAVGAKIINKKMLSSASHALSGIVDPTQPGASVLPPVSKLEQFSTKIAEVVGQSAIDQGLAKDGITDAKKAVADAKWIPRYR